MKKLIFIYIFFIALSTNAQEYSIFLPYQYNNLYGLVNDKQERIVEPKYKKVEIINEFSFALFDDINCYDLSNGKYVSIPKSKENSFVVINNELFVFNSKLNTLVNPYSKEIISLKLKYKFFYNKTLYDFNSKKSYDLIFAYTTDNKQFFFKNDKSLTAAILGKINFDNFDLLENTVDNFDRTIGIIILNPDKSLSCYNYDGSKSFKITSSDISETNENYIQFKESVHKKFVDFYGFESEFFPSSFSLSKLGMASSGRFHNRFIDNINIGNGFTLTSKSYNYDLKSNPKIYFKDVKFDGIYHFNYTENQLFLKFNKISTKEEVQIFTHHPKINPNIIMLPKEDLSKFELIN